LGGVWLALIGWFVVSAATAEKKQARLDGQADGATVAPSGADPTSLPPDRGGSPPDR
jgi:hypothetical protein